MSDRSVRVRVEVAIAQARRDMKGLGDDVETSAKKVVKAGQELDKVGTTLTRAGLVGAAGLGLVTKAAIDWETAWTGVTKTVDGTPEQMAQLEQGLRGLSKQLPASAEEIAGVAEAAGQLGVKQKDILGFTKTMVDLSESTNLSSDEAATAIAQIGNVTGLLEREGAAGVRKFGSTLVALGNNGASTERDIVQMASRIAGAGKIVGLTEPELLAISNALASVGIEAEAGGTAVSKVLIDMSKAVKQGGKDLTGFASVAGVSADEFAKKFTESPAQAMVLFTNGLNRIKESGGDVFTTLDELGQSDVRTSAALLKMAGAGDLLSNSLQLGNQAWEQNNALTTEAEKRYQTAASRIEIAKNKANDAAITMGGALAPTVASAAEAAGDLANSFNDLSPSTQSTVVRIATVTTGILLFSGAAIKTVRGVQAARRTIEALGVSSEKSGKLLGKAVVALAAVAAAGAALNSSKAGDFGVEQLTKDLLASTDAVSAFDDMLKQAADSSALVSGELDSTGEILSRAFNPTRVDDINSGMDTLLTTVTLGMVDVESSTEYASRRLEELDGALGQLASGGNTDQAAALFAQFAKAAEAQGISVDELKAKFPQYQEALAAINNGQTLAAGSGSDLASSMSEVTTETDQAKQSTEDFIKTLNDLNQPQLDVRAANRKVKESIAAISEALKENGKALNDNKTGFDTNTEAGLRNEAALDDVASALNAQLGAMQAAGAGQQELDSQLRTSREELYQTARRMGLTEEAARLYVEQVLAIPPSKQTVATFKTVGLSGLQQAQDYLHNIRDKHVTLTVGTVQVGNTKVNAGQFGDGRATGGAIVGPGTGTSDSIPAMLSNGEHVWTAAEVAKLGGQSEMYALRAAVRAGSVPRFAGGGEVGSGARSFGASHYAGPAPLTRLHPDDVAAIAAAVRSNGVAIADAVRAGAHSGTASGISGQARAIASGRGSR
ncbi:phage tail tape measure protein [Phycicoccus sp.]|uniref:phage tail tape measure protein n=1 Tax=Phycicoccus sp. TaxID=1902410 RepID=UPI002D1295B0|nr:phage tail tape measure protein [Phycicoccus sp.]HMM96702.1 phage tail tape measure protein [Phycicoccus sp.]